MLMYLAAIISCPFSKELTSIFAVASIPPYGVLLYGVLVTLLVRLDIMFRGSVYEMTVRTKQVIFCVLSTTVVLNIVWFIAFVWLMLEKQSNHLKIIEIFSYSPGIIFPLWAGLSLYGIGTFYRNIRQYADRSLRQRSTNG